jgi:hypothetical protein
MGALFANGCDRERASAASGRFLPAGIASIRPQAEVGQRPQDTGRVPAVAASAKFSPAIDLLRDRQSVI